MRSCRWAQGAVSGEEHLERGWCLHLGPKLDLGGLLGGPELVPDHAPQGVDQGVVDHLPGEAGEAGAGATEVTQARGGLVAGALELQPLDDGGRAQVHEFADGLLEDAVVHDAGAMGVDEHAAGLGDADGVAELHIDAASELANDQGLGEPAGLVGRAAVHLAGVLARERTAAVAAEAAVGVHDDLATGQAAVTVGAAGHEATGGVHLVDSVVGEQVGGDDRLDDVLDDPGLDFGVLDLLRVLGGDEHAAHRDGHAALVDDSDLALPELVSASVRRVGSS